jgi:hypothetical protein
LFSNRAFPKAVIAVGIFGLVLSALTLKSHEDDIFQWAPIFGLGLLLICIGLGIHEFRQMEPSDIDPEGSATPPRRARHVPPRPACRNVIDAGGSSPAVSKSDR